MKLLELYLVLIFNDIRTAYERKAKKSTHIFYSNLNSIKSHIYILKYILCIICKFLMEIKAFNFLKTFLKISEENDLQKLSFLSCNMFLSFLSPKKWRCEIPLEETCILGEKSLLKFVLTFGNIKWVLFIIHRKNSKIPFLCLFDYVNCCVWLYLRWVSADYLLFMK